MFQNLARYSDVSLQSLNGFCIPDDKALLQEFILRLLAWVQNTRKVLVDMKANKTKINDTQKKKLEKQQGKMGMVLPASEQADKMHVQP